MRLGLPLTLGQGYQKLIIHLGLPNDVYVAVWSKSGHCLRR